MQPLTLENKHPREPHNFYPEGPSASDALFRSGLIDKETVVYDPAMGCGSIVRMAQGHGFTATGGDIRTGKNFLAAQPAEFTSMSPFTVVTNSPYGGPRGDRIEMKFIEHAVALGAVDVWALLPLPWMAVRIDWLGTMGCTGVYILQPRLSILPYSAMKDGRWPGGGGKDYAWYRFQPIGIKSVPFLYEIRRNPELDTKENWTWWDGNAA